MARPPGLNGTGCGGAEAPCARYASFAAASVPPDRPSTSVFPWAEEPLAAPSPAGRRPDEGGAAMPEPARRPRARRRWLARGAPSPALRAPSPRRREGDARGGASGCGPINAMRSRLEPRIPARNDAADRAGCVRLLFDSPPPPDLRRSSRPRRSRRSGRRRGLRPRRCRRRPCRSTRARWGRRSRSRPDFTSASRSPTIWYFFSSSVSSSMSFTVAPNLTTSFRSASRRR